MNNNLNLVDVSWHALCLGTGHCNFLPAPYSYPLLRHSVTSTDDLRRASRK